MTSLARPQDEVANAVTHAIGFGLSVPAAIALLNRAGNSSTNSSTAVWWACAVYATTLLLVYACSTLSHLGTQVTWRRRWRTCDQASIFLLIAGSYTPFGVQFLNQAGWGWLLVAMWSVATVGVARVVCVGDLSPGDKLLFGIHGVLPAFALLELSRQVPLAVIGWIVAGGSCYGIGSLFLRMSARVRYSHAMWHLLVIAGSACHYVAIWQTIGLEQLLEMNV